MLKKIRKFILQKYVLTLILFILALGLLVLIQFAVWKWVLRPEPIADFLPIDKTITYIEMNIDPVNPQIDSFMKLTQSHPFYAKQYFIRKIEDFTEKSYVESIAPWLGNSIATALIITETASPEPVFFIEYKNKSRVLEFLRSLSIQFKNDSLQETAYNSHKIYSYKFSQDFAFTFVGNYLVAAQNTQTIQKYIDAISKNFTAISAVKEYSDANQNYFDLSLAHAYINLPLLSKTIAAQQSLQENQKYFFLAFDPLINIFKNTFVQLEAKNGYLEAKTFTAFSGKFIKNTTPYTASLAKYFPSNIKVFYGGQDLTRQISNFSRMIDENGAKFKKAVNDITQTQLKEIFGKELSFETDIYPLLADEYAFAINQDDSILLAIKLRDSTLIQEKLKTLKIKDGVYWKIRDDVLLLSSAEILTTGQSFSESEIFASLIKPFIGNSDEISYYALNRYRESLLSVSPYFLPFSAIAGGSKYDEFYVKTVYYVLADGG